MSKVNVIHTADWHLREAHLGLISRGPDFLRAALSTVDIAADVRDATGNPTIMVVAGDQLQSTRLSAENAGQLRAVDAHMIEKGITALSTIGNHDLARTGHSWVDVMCGKGGAGEWVHDFNTPGLKDVTGKHFDWHGLRFHGLPPVASSALPETLAALQVNPGLSNIGIWHGALRDFIGFPVENMLAIADLDLSKLTAFLLGDIHVSQYYSAATGCVVGYPGATELCSAREPLEHSCTHFEFTNGVISAVVTKPVKHRKAMAFRVINDDQAAEVISKIKAAEHECPIVLLRYASNMEKVCGMIRANVDTSKVILRDAALDDDISTQAMSLMAVTSAAQRLSSSTETPEQVLMSLLVGDDDYKNLGASLCNPNADHALEIKRYIASQLAKPESIKL